MVRMFLVLVQSFLLVSSREVGVRIVNRVPDLCTTRSGDVCVFPFIYEGVRYDRCSYARSEAAWCATEVDRVGEVVAGRWGDCNTHPESSCEVESVCKPGDHCPGKYHSWTSLGGKSPEQIRRIFLRE